MLLSPMDYISLPLRISITDGRIVTGVLLAIDDESNLLLTNVYEYMAGNQRDLGMVSVPRKTILKVEASSDEYSKLEHWKNEQMIGEKLNGVSL